MPVPGRHVEVMTLENIVVTTPGFLAVLTALASISLFFTVRHWSRRRIGRGVILTLMTIFLTLAATADFVNAHYDYAPQARDVVDVAFPGFEYRTLSMSDVTKGISHPHGGVVRVALGDNGDGFGKSHELVYVPRSYFTTSTALPVVYLLHGSPGSAEDWFRAAHAASVGAALDKLGEPAILVAPEMSRGWAHDSECIDSEKLQAETHLLDMVVPTTQRLFRVRSDRSGRVIAGNSAGGYCALNLGLRHWDDFSTIIDLSGFTHPTHDHGLTALFGTGVDLAKKVRENSPDMYAPALPPGPPTAIWFDAGRSDHESLNEETRLIAAIGQRQDIVTKLTVRPGGHTYGVWRPALQESLIWAVKQTGGT